MIYVLIAILLLGILIAVHEAGHFLFSRLCGIAVKEFSIGFGPKLLQRTGKNDTKYTLRLIPMGGYCAYYGEDDIDGKELNDPRAFGKQPVWKRMIAVLMGPGMNFIFAFVVLVVWLWVSGYSMVQPYIASVEAGGPAAAAGMQAGDVVLRVDGREMAASSIDPFLNTVSTWQEGTEPLLIQVQRADGTADLSITPVWDAEAAKYRIGIAVSGALATDADGNTLRTPMLLTDAITLSWENCIWAGGAILGALRDLVTTGQGLESTTGPVGIVQEVSQSVRTGGLDAFLNLLVLISINLGLMNLLPIPGLDGSRFLFLVLEAIRRKPIPPQKEAAVHLAGMVLLLALTLVLTFRDVGRLFH